MKTLHEQEYKIIISRSDILEQFVKADCSRDLPNEWLKEVTNIYTKHTRRITGSCESCRANMLRWLIRSVKEYEANRQNGQ